MKTDKEFRWISLLPKDKTAVEHRIELAPRVHVDLDEIFAYIAEKSSLEIASSLEGKLYKRIASLCLMPERCSEAPESKHRRKTYRHTFEGEYRIIFFVADSAVRVVHIRHGKRLPAKPRDLK